MNEEKNIRFSGAGGQCIILAATIYAAANVYEQRYALQIQVYEPRVRGGVSYSDVVISREPIDYPDMSRLDMLLCLTNESYNAFKYLVDKNTLLVYDKKIKVSEDNAYGFEIVKTAVEKFETIQQSNMIALGIISALRKELSADSIEKAIEEYTGKSKKINIEAFKIGMELV